jgi:hypothetical protein
LHRPLARWLDNFGQEENVVNRSRIRIAAAATIVGLGGLAGLALSDGQRQSSTTVAEKPAVRTKVIRRTIHVTKHAKPKHPAVAGAGGGASAGSSASAGSPGSAVTGASSSGSTSSSSYSSPVTTSTSGSSSAGTATSYESSPVVTGSSGASAGSGSSGESSAPVTTATSGGGSAGGGGGEVDHESKGGGDD